MHKRSLEFGFEGAFYKAWHITNKTYLGQKIECITTKVCDNGIIIPSCHIDEEINFDDFDVTDDAPITKYLASKHIKTTGLKLIKRNTIKLAVMYYLKVISYVLNNHLSLALCNINDNDDANDNDNGYGDNIVEQLLIELRDSFDNLPLLTLMEKKKVTKKF